MVLPALDVGSMPVVILNRVVISIDAERTIDLPPFGDVCPTIKKRVMNDSSDNKIGENQTVCYVIDMYPVSLTCPLTAKLR